MSNIVINREKTKKKGKFLGKNLVLLPKIFATIFTNPKYTAKSLDLLVLLAQNGVEQNTLHLPKKTHTSYIKNVVVPFLATLKIKDTVGDIKVFDCISYNTGMASISYEFSSYIKQAFDEIQAKTLKNGKILPSKGYIIVNVDEFVRLKGLYTKQLYLSLCAWQKEQSLDLFRCGGKSLFELWQLPSAYKNRLLPKILKPAIDKINAFTSLHIIKISCYSAKYSLVYKRLDKKSKKNSDLTVVIDRHPNVARKLPNYGFTAFTQRMPFWKQEKKPPNNNIMPTAEEYCERLVDAGVERGVAKDIARKKYKLNQRHFACQG